MTGFYLFLALVASSSPGHPGSGTGAADEPVFIPQHRQEVPGLGAGGGSSAPRTVRLGLQVRPLPFPITFPSLPDLPAGFGLPGRISFAPVEFQPPAPFSFQSAGTLATDPGLTQGPLDPAEEPLLW